MGWEPQALGGPEFLILSTHGGCARADGTPIALGYHTGHWEVGLLVEAAAREFTAHGAVPFAGYCTDPCDGRTQGTAGMFDSLPYRNDAAIVFRRLIRSLPTRKRRDGGRHLRQGSARHDDGAGRHARDLPCVLVPGGVTLPPDDGEDAGKVQTIGARFAHGADHACEDAAEPGLPRLRLARRRLPVPGHRGHRRRWSAEALGLALPHSALAPVRPADLARHGAALGARAAGARRARHHASRDILTDAAVRNAMVVHAAFGGSTNLLLHMPAIAHAAGLRAPHGGRLDAVNRHVPRLVDALPNGPRNHPTVQVFLAGGVPEVMLHLRRAGLLERDVLTATGETLGACSTGGRTRRGGTPCARCSGSATASIRTTSSWTRRRRGARGITSTVTFPTATWRPRAR